MVLNPFDLPFLTGSRPPMVNPEVEGRPPMQSYPVDVSPRSLLLNQALQQGMYGPMGGSNYVPDMNPPIEAPPYSDEAKKRALSQALMAAGFTMMGQGPTPYKPTIGQGIGQAGLAGLNAYNQKLNEDLKNAQYQQLLNNRMGIAEIKTGDTGWEKILDKNGNWVAVNPDHPELGVKQLGVEGNEKMPSTVFKTYARTNPITGKEDLWTINEKDLDNKDVLAKLNAGGWHPYAAPTIGSISQATPGSVEQIGEDLFNGKMNWDQAQQTLGRSTSDKTKLQKYMAAMHPGFNYWESSAMAKYYGATNTQDRIRFIDSLVGNPEKGEMGQLEYVKQLSHEVDRTQFPFINKAILKANKDYVGDEPTARFMAGLFNVAVEAARAAASSGAVIPQERVDQELERMAAAYNQKQLDGVFDVVKNELLMRRAAMTKNTPGENKAPAMTPGGKKESTTMSEVDARAALGKKGITGPDQDAWIQKYKAAGKVQ